MLIKGPLGLFFRNKFVYNNGIGANYIKIKSFDEKV